MAMGEGEETCRSSKSSFQTLKNKVQAGQQGFDTARAGEWQLISCQQEMISQMNAYGDGLPYLTESSQVLITIHDCSRPTFFRPKR